VPIPPIELKSKKHCCALKSIPLSLACAKTGHTFQGQNIGPNHPIQCIIVHPGNKRMEYLCPGLLYMFASMDQIIQFNVSLYIQGTKEWNIYALDYCTCLHQWTKSSNSMYNCTSREQRNGIFMPWTTVHVCINSYHYKFVKKFAQNQHYFFGVMA
jgi:hypothetical protein